MTRDALAGVRWECASTDPDLAECPADLPRTTLDWIPAPVPGTAAGALRAHGSWRPGVADRDLLDGRDWWFRCRFANPHEGPWVLHLRGLATIADVWLNDTRILHSENMFLEHRHEIDRLTSPEPSDNELCIRFAALAPVLARRRPRPRWKSRHIRDQRLRWIRTTLLGRMDGWSAWAAPVGPWRPVELVPLEPTRVVSSSVDAECTGTDGSVTVRIALAVSGRPPSDVRIRVGDATAPLEVSGEGAQLTAEGSVRLHRIARWWPHTHGRQPRYPVTLVIDGAPIPLTTVGFRTVDVDRTDDGFTFVVNDTPIFCRGAIWVPPDIVSLSARPEALRASLELLRDTGMNMVRLSGYGTYESPEFWDLCDELGIMVWQDCMLASYEPPDDDQFTAAIAAETVQVLTRLQGRPSLALVCGSNETYQQAAMFGLAPDTWKCQILETTIPSIVERTLPGIPYIPSSPIGGDLPFDPSSGVAHYFGTGAYCRGLSDARFAHVRFAAECLAFSVPPERRTVAEEFGGSTAALDAPSWKAGVPRDGGAAWDFEDVRDFYVRELFGCDPAEVRRSDPDRALDLGRAAVAEVMAAVMTEWRRPGSGCAGGLILSWQDLWPGAGWGLVDTRGRPKAPVWVLRRVLGPLAVLITDEGLAGLRVHVLNDRERPFEGRLRLAVYADSGRSLEHADETITVAARGHYTTSAAALLGGFRDLTRAYRFGPPEHDVVHATLTSNDDRSVREAFYLPLGHERAPRSDLGLTAGMSRVGPVDWELTVAGLLFAQSIVVDLPGCTPSDSWFHLAPGASRIINVRTDHPDRTPQGEVRALNSLVPTPILAEGSARH